MLAPKDPSGAATNSAICVALLDRFTHPAESVLHVEELWPKSLLDAEQVGQHIDMFEMLRM